MGFQKFWRDRESGKGFEEYGPGREDSVGGQHREMGEEACSLGGGFASSLPGGFQKFERRVPGESEEVERRQHHGEKRLAMAEIVFEFVAVIFHHVEALILDLPPRPAANGDLGDIIFGDGKARDPGHGIFDAALRVHNLEGNPVDQHRVLAVA